MCLCNYQTDALVQLLPLIGSSTARYFVHTRHVWWHLIMLSCMSCNHAYLVTNHVCVIMGSTAFLVGITGVLAPLLEETVFRGFLMASLTKWWETRVYLFFHFIQDVMFYSHHHRQGHHYHHHGALVILIIFLCRVPTPVAALASAAVFAVAHLAPNEFPQLFVLGGSSSSISSYLMWVDLIHSCQWFLKCRLSSRALLRSDKESFHTHPHPCSLELWRHYSAHLPSSSSITSLSLSLCICILFIYLLTCAWLLCSSKAMILNSWFRVRDDDDDDVIDGWWWIIWSSPSSLSGIEILRRYTMMMLNFVVDNLFFPGITSLCLNQAMTVS